LVKFDALLIEVDELQQMLIIITETWLHSKVLDPLIQISGSAVYVKNRVDTIGAGIIYVQHSRCVPVIIKLFHDDTHVDTVWLVVAVDGLRSSSVGYTDLRIQLGSQT